VGVSERVKSLSRVGTIGVIFRPDQESTRKIAVLMYAIFRLVTIKRSQERISRNEDLRIDSGEVSWFVVH
jgi:hypothetical protein